MTNSDRTALVLRRAEARKVHPVRILGRAKGAHVGDAAELGTGALVGLLILPIILIALFLNAPSKA
jgi:hypothetical protein